MNHHSPERHHELPVTPETAYNLVRLVQQNSDKELAGTYEDQQVVVHGQLTPIEELNDGSIGYIRITYGPFNPISDTEYRTRYMLYGTEERIEIRKLIVPDPEPLDDIPEEVYDMGLDAVINAQNKSANRYYEKIVEDDKTYGDGLEVVSEAEGQALIRCIRQSRPAKPRIPSYVKGSIMLEKVQDDIEREQRRDERIGKIAQASLRFLQQFGIYPTTLREE